MTNGSIEFEKYTINYCYQVEHLQDFVFCCFPVILKLIFYGCRSIFLMVICAYGLSSEFNFKEIECLFWSVSHHKQAPILGLILGFVDQTLGKSLCVAFTLSCIIGFVD